MFILTCAEKWVVPNLQLVLIQHPLRKEKELELIHPATKKNEVKQRQEAKI